jgi:hypothetical protein
MKNKIKPKIVFITKFVDWINSEPTRIKNIRNFFEKKQKFFFLNCLLNNPIYNGIHSDSQTVTCPYAYFETVLFTGVSFILKSLDEIKELILSYGLMVLILKLTVSKFSSSFWLLLFSSYVSCLFF